MSNGSELRSKGAIALRAAGYKPCPRWWLTDEQMELVSYMARQNEDAVNQIRAETYRPEPVSEEEQRRRDEDARRWGIDV